MDSLKRLFIKHRKILKKIFMVVAVVSIVVTAIEIPREIYFAVRSHNYDHDLDNRDYWPVHDYYGNEVNIFEFEDYLENCGAEDIKKGYYYKDSGNTAICYDFNADGIRFVMDNEIIVGNPYTGYNGGINIQSRLSVYEGDVVYRTDYLSGSEYVMDYRSPMWVERRIFNLLHDKMDSIKNGCYDHSKCPFSGSGISHYEEMDNGTYCWHEDVYG